MKELCSNCLQLVTDTFNTTNPDFANIVRVEQTKYFFDEMTGRLECRKKRTCLPAQMLQTRLDNETKRKNV